MQYVEILPDGTRRTVKYKRNDGPVSQFLSHKKRLKYLQKHPHHAKPGELRKLNKLLQEERRKLESNRRNVAQSKSTYLLGGKKGRFQTNKRNTNRDGLAAKPGDGGTTGNGHAFIPDTTAALSLQTGCEVTPQGCTNGVGGQTAVEPKGSESSQLN